MTPDLRDELDRLAKSHPVPSDDKLKRRIAGLERMKKFYEEKEPEAPEHQALMFKGFVTALFYALSIIKMYRKLTIKLAELAEGQDGNDT